jgi:hypothetical protein
MPPMSPMPLCVLWDPYDPYGVNTRRAHCALPTMKFGRRRVRGIGVIGGMGAGGINGRPVIARGSNDTLMPRGWR